MEDGRGGWWTCFWPRLLRKCGVGFRVAQRVPIPCVLECDTWNPMCGCAGARVCTAQDMVQVRCTAAVSCHVLFVYGALRSVTLAEDTRLPALRAWTPQPHAPYCFSSSRCSHAEKIPSTSVLPFSHSLGLASSGRVTPSRASPDFWVSKWWLDLRTDGLRLEHPTCDRLGCSASRWWLTPHWERVECLSIRTGCSCTGSDQRPQGLSVRGFRSPTTSHTRALTVSTTQSSPSTQCLKSSRPTMMGTRLPSESPEKRRPKTVPATNVHHPGRHNLHERLGSETRSGETASDCQGVPEKRKPFLALGVPMSRGSNCVD